MKNRSIVFVIIMSIVSLGIYGIYWMFSTRNELVKKGQRVPSPWIVILAAVFSFLVIAFLQILKPELPIFAQFTNPTDSYSTTPLMIWSIAIGFVGVIVALYWMWKYSKAVEIVTRGSLSAKECFALAAISTFFGIGFVWMATVQHEFNKLATVYE